MATKKKTIKELEAEWDSRSPQKNKKTTKELETEWDSGSTQRNAGFAVGDFITIKDNLPGLAESYADKQYKLGGSAKIQKSGIIPEYSEYAKYAPIISNNLAAGKDYLGLTDDEVAEYQAYIQQIAKDSVWGGKMATARTGGLDSIDMTGMPKAQKQELGRMDNLSQRDTVYDKLQRNPDQEYYEHNYGDIFGGMSEKEYLDRLTAYYRSKKNQEAAQKKYDEWKAGADAETAKILAMPEYEANSVYKGGSEYLTPDNAYLEGYDHYTDENGVTLSAKQYREKVVNETIAALVDAGNDPAKLEALRGNIEMLPELNNNDYNYEALPYMTDEQRSAFFTLYNSGKTDAAKDYLRHTLDYGLRKAYVEDSETQLKKDLEEANALEKAAYSALTVPINLINEAQGAVLAAKGAVDPEYIAGVHEFDPMFDATRTSQTVRGEIGQDIAEGAQWANIPGTDMNLAQMGYNALMSAGDSALNAFLFGGAGAWAPTTAMGAGAFTSELMESQDYWDALAAGIIEGGTEYLPFDIIGSGAIRPGAKVAYNMLAEALGEGTAETLNTVYDTIKNGTDSEAGQRVDELITQGYTKKDAILKVIGEKGLDVLESGITGAMSGVSAAPTAISEYSADKKTGANLATNEAQYDLADLAETVGVNGQAADIMRRLQAEHADKTKGDKAESAIAEKGGVTKADAESAVREAEQTARDKAERSDEGKVKTEADNAAVTKADAEAVEREAEMTERDKAERADETKEIAEEDAAAVTAEDVEALENAEMNARDKAERAEEGKSVSEQDAAAVTAEDVKAAKTKEQAKRDRKENAGKKKGAKAVSKAEIGYLYRETMSKLDKEAQNIVSKNFSRDIRNELDLLGYDGDSKRASEAIAKFAMGEIAPETLDILENSKVARDIALSYVGKIEYRNSLYDRAYDIARRASKDYVKPESTKAEKGAQEATQGIDDRAAVGEDDIMISDTPESTVDGVSVTIEDTSVDEDGNVTLTVTDAEGNTRELAEKDVQIGQNDSALAVMIANARELGENAKAMIEMRMEDQDAAEYAAAFKSAVQYGEDGRDIGAVENYADLNILNREQLQAAYDAGRRVRTRRNSVLNRKSALGVPVGRVDTSRINMNTLEPNQAATVRFVSSIAKAAGFNVRFVESKADADGKYRMENGSWDPRTLTLTLDVHAGSNGTDDTNYAMIHTAGHELTHYIKQFADGELWNSYQEFVIGHLSKKESETFSLDDEIAKIIKAEEDNGRTLSREAAIEEVIADASGEALNRITEEDIRSLAQTNPTLIGRLKAFFKQWIGNMKKLISDAYKGTEAKTETARQMMDAVDEMGKRWNEMLVNATRNKSAVKPDTLSYTHIDQRTFESVKEQDGELFVSEVEEAQIGMAAAAKILIADLDNSLPGEKLFLADGEVTGQKRQTSELLGRMKDALKTTWAKLRSGLKQFAAMETSEELPKNTITNRRMELYLNEMLTEGYTTLDGTHIKPWDEYTEAMRSMEGSAGAKEISTPEGAVEFAEYAWPEEVKYSVRKNADGRSIVVVDEDILKGIYSGGKWTQEQKNKAKKAAKAAIKSAGPIYSEGIPFYVNSKTRDELPSSRYVRETLGKKREMLADRYRIASETEDLILAAVEWENEPLKKERTDFAGFVKGRVYMDIHGRKYEAVVKAGVTKDGRHVLYDLVDMKNEGISSTAQADNATALYSEKPSSKNSIAQPDQEVKSQARNLSRMSDREILADAMLTVANSTVEAEIIENYRKRIDKLNKKQKELEEVNAKIAELRAESKADPNEKPEARKARMEKMKKAHEKARELKASIVRADSQLISMESAKVLKDMLAYAKEEARKSTAERIRKQAEERRIRDVQRAKEAGQARIRNMRGQQEYEKYKKQTLEEVKKLHKWVTAPDKKGRAPEFLREPLAKFIKAFDFSSETKLRGKGETYSDNDFKLMLNELNDAITRISDQQSSIEESAEIFAGYIDLPVNFRTNFNENVRNIIKVIDAASKKADTPINRMTAAQMKEMAQAFKILNHSILKINEYVSEGGGLSAKLAADKTIDDLLAMKARTSTNKALEMLNSGVNWKNATPYYVFERLGRGGEDIFERLQNGWDRMAYNSAKVIEFAKDTFDAKESREWSREITDVKLDSDDVIQMTTAQKMSLYCLQKRQQAQGHLLGGGIRVGDIDGKKGRKISQTENYVLTVEDINRITSSLTQRQREVADKLQDFMNTVCKDWGNDISMKRFGYRQMTEMFYFPIETDANNRRSIDESKDGSTSMFRLLNMASLKPLTPNANNAIVIKDIFDVFSDHASDMAKYNAMALPILDFIKWYNYVERSDVKGEDGKATGQITTRSVQKALELAYGKDAKSYLTTFIRDLNAEHDGGRNDGLINSIIGKAKSAAVGANLRVYALQVTSLPRAAYAIHPKYLMAGAAKLKSLNPASAIKGTEAQEEIGILKWKSLGFYSTDIARSTREMVKRNDGFFGKVKEWQMTPAGWGDNWVSNIIYEAVKAEMRELDRYKHLRPGSADYKRALNERVREIVYKTQVVDSTMTRSELMRSKGLASMLTAFMSEPTLTVNMLNESIQKAVELGRKGGNTKEILRATGGLATRAATVWIFTSIVTGLMESVWDAIRDDDEYETFLEKIRDAVFGDKWYNGNIVQNLNPITMLPLLNDFWSIAVEGYEDNSLAKQVATQFRSLMDAVKSYKKGNTTLYNVIYKGMQTVSSMSGVGAANAARDGVSLYNTFLAPAWGTPKVQTSEESEKTVTTAMYKAAMSGDTVKFEKLMSRAKLNGITTEDLENEYNNLVSDDYIAGNIDSNEAKRIFKMYGGKTEYQAQTLVDKLDYEKKTGNKFSKLESDYVSGNISKADAKKALTTYGDTTAADADAKILTWDYEKATGRKYSTISNEYIRGTISRSEIKKALVNYGGQSGGDAEKTILHLDFQKKTNRPWSKLMDDYIGGRFTRGQVKDYLMNYDQKDENEALDIVDKYDWAKTHGGSTDGYSKYVTVHEAIDSGRGFDEAVEALVEKYTARGETRKEVLSSIRSSITSKYKPIYLAASEAEQARMREKLLDVYVALGGSYNTYYKNMTDKWFED